MKVGLLLLLLVGAAWNVFCTVDVQQLNASDMTITFKLPEYKIDTNEMYSKINCLDLTGYSQAGYPNIPYQEYKIAVPSDGDVQISILSNQLELQTLKLPLEPVPTIERTGKSDKYSYIVNPEAYRSKRSIPWEVTPVQSYRQWNFVSLKIYPFAYDNSSKELKIQRSITFQVHITGNVNQRMVQTDKLKDSFLKEMLNGSSAQFWGNKDAPDINFAEFSKSDHWYSFEVHQDGIYAITYDQLRAVLNIQDVPPDSIRIFSTGGQVMSLRVNDVGLPFQEIPLLIDAGNDSSFDQGDRIIFYGLDRDDYSQNSPIIQDVNSNFFYAPIYFNPYSQNVKYWLTYTGSFNTSPVRITNSAAIETYNLIRTSHPEILQLESDRLKREPNPIGFYMFQSLLAGSSTSTHTYSFNLENVNLSVQQKITTTLRQQILSGATLPIHYMGLTLNQNTVVTSASYTADNYGTISRSGFYCQNGSNQLILTIYRTQSENIYLDYFRIEYEKYLIKSALQAYRINVHATDYNQNIRYEVTSSNTAPARIFKITGFDQASIIPNEIWANGFAFQAAGTASTRFYAVQDGDYLSVVNLRAEAPVDLTTQLLPIENLIITPAEFKSNAEQLKMFYEEQLNVAARVVDVQDIYNQFNAGMPDPTAIRQYIRYCFYHYPSPALTSVTLLGAGTNDWRNQTGAAASKNKMIAYQRVLAFTSEITSDDYFVMISPNNSSYPELAIGRYPAKTNAEMSLMINRLIKYSTEPNPGWWKNTLQFFADDDTNGPDQINEWIHSQYVEQGSNLVNRSVIVDKIFGIDYDTNEFGNKPQARDDMIAKLNEGRLVWYYNGHGSYDKLGTEDYFNGFSDMSRLTNTEHLPIFLAASCDVGEFDSYTFDCLAEKLVLLANGGSIVSFASTRLCYSGPNSALMNYLFERSINQRISIGEGIRLAKFTSSSDDNDATYVLLGDPVLPVLVPQKNTEFKINAVSNQLQARQTAIITGDFENPALNGTTEMRAYDSDLRYRMGDNSVYTKNNNPIFKGNLTLNQGMYNGGFVIPDDIVGGTTARIISYVYDAQSSNDYVNYYSPLILRGHDYIADNPDSPNVKLFLETTAFRTGDQVSTTPLLIAEITDSTGINILGAAGHKILLIMDNSSEYLDVTDYFIYNTNSYTKGTLSCQLPEIAEGNHQLQLIVFDNFNRPTVAETQFTAKKSGSLTILKMLPYPNPMKKDGIFTLVLNDEGNITLSIYTITGKKIRTIKQAGQLGYNQVSWDGRDEDGDFLANNTYLYKVQVKNGSKKAEKTGQFMIYH